MSALPAPARETCSVELHPIGSGRAEGDLVGHPARPALRTRLDADVLAVEIVSGGRTIGTGKLTIDHLAEPPVWNGEVTIDGCRWWASSPVGCGVITLSSPRRPFRAVL